MGNKPFKAEPGAEQKLAEAVASAKEVNFTGKPDPERTVRADFFRALLLGLVEGYDPPPGPVRARALRIEGALDLEGCGDAGRPLPALLMPLTEIEGKLNLHSATMGALRIPSGRVGGLYGWGAHIGGDLHAPSLVVGDGRINLVNARIDGDVVLRRAAAPVNVPLTAIELVAATIARDLDLNGVHLLNRTGYALIADGAEIGGNVFLRSDRARRFEAEGELRFRGARIGGDLSATGARLVGGTSGATIFADGVEIVDSLFLRPELAGDKPFQFESHGCVSLPGARMLNLFAENAAFISEGSALVLDLDSAIINNDLRVGDSLKRLGYAAEIQSHGAINLTGARVGELEDDGGDGWGAEPREWLLYEQGGELEGGGGVSLKLDGFVYARLADLKKNDPEKLWNKRRRWLKRQYGGREPTTELFTPQPYEQAARAFREAGHALEARQASMAKRDIMVRCGIERWYVRAIQWLFGRMFGYGYSPGRTLITLALTLFAAIVFEDGLRDIGALVATEARGPCTATPGLYAFDAILPIVQLGYASKCEVSADGPVAAWLWSGFRVTAWIIVTLAALTFSGVLRRD